MFTDPDMIRYIGRQREAELIADAARSRLARSLRKGRRGRWLESRRGKTDSTN